MCEKAYGNGFRKVAEFCLIIYPWGITVCFQVIFAKFVLQILDDTFHCGFFAEDGRSTDTYSSKGTSFLLRRNRSRNNGSFSNLPQSAPHPQEINRPAAEDINHRSHLSRLQRRNSGSHLPPRIQHQGHKRIECHLLRDYGHQVGLDKLVYNQGLEWFLAAHARTGYSNILLCQPSAGLSFSL